MRGQVSGQEAMWSYISPDARVPAGHPVRPLTQVADEALQTLEQIFDKMYGDVGRPSIPPERLLKAQLLIALYSVRSDRLFCERLDYDILFRWFLDMNLEEPRWDHRTFSANRDRLLAHDVARRFFDVVVSQARCAGLLSDEHFTVDGTLIEACASLKSLTPKAAAAPPDDPGTPTVDFHGERRTNAIHQSTTAPEARLARKGAGKEAKRCFSGHVLMENRHGLCVDLQIAPATGTAERDTARAMLRRQARRGVRLRTLGLIRAIIAKRSCATCVSAGFAPTSRASAAVVPRGSMGGRRATRAMPSANESANGSKRSSDGSRRSAGCGRPDSAGWRARNSPDTWLGWRTICGGSAGCFARSRLGSTGRRELR